jgi:dTDP-4-amino-4,6-dideoxygalactose transaminase
VTTQPLALLGGDPCCDFERPAYPVFTETAISRVADVLRSGRTVGLSKANEHIREAEETLAAWHGVPHCLGTSSGHAALHSALIGMEVAEGDEVISSPYSWGASISCILHCGAIPTFVDVDPVTGLLDPAALPDQLSERTRAILVPHIYGQPAEMTAILEFARAHDLAVIEDCSQAHGARHKGRRVGSYGDAAGFSCMGFKPLGTTEAGFMLTQDASVYFKAAISTQHPHANDNPGRADERGFPSDLAPFLDSLLYTYRLNAVSAVLIVEQLKKLDAENENRASNRQALIDALDGVGSVSIPDYGEDDAVFHFLTMNFAPQSAGVSKETYTAALQAEGVPIFSYVTRPLSSCLRLRADSGAPRTVWTEPMRRSSVDYDALQLPGCDAKIAQSLEISWNYIEPADARVVEMADAFAKVEENLPALREYEASSASTGGV